MGELRCGRGELVAQRFHPERFAGFEREIRGTFAAYKPWAYMTEPSRQQMLRHLRSRLPVALAGALETDRNPLGGSEGILLCTG